MIGPVQIEAKVHFLVSDKLASATVGLGPGEAPTEERLLRAIGDALQAARRQFKGHPVRLMDPEEFFNGVVVAERTGRRGNFALPVSFTFDVEAVEAAALAAASKVDE